MQYFRDQIITEADKETQDQKPGQSNQQDAKTEPQPKVDPNAGSKTVKLEVIKSIKEIQAQLTSITFLDALSKVHADNTVKKDIEGFETTLSDLRRSIEDFVNDNHFDSAERQAEENPEGNSIEGGDDAKAEDEKKAKEAEEKNKISISGEKDIKDDEDKDEKDKKESKKDKKKVNESKSFKSLMNL